MTLSQAGERTLSVPALRNRSSSSPKSRGAARLLRGLSALRSGAGGTSGSVLVDGIEKARECSGGRSGQRSERKDARLGSVGIWQNLLTL